MCRRIGEYISLQLFYFDNLASRCSLIPCVLIHSLGLLHQWWRKSYVTTHDAYAEEDTQKLNESIWWSVQQHHITDIAHEATKHRPWTSKATPTHPRQHSQNQGTMEATDRGLLSLDVDSDLERSDARESQRAEQANNRSRRRDSSRQLSFSIQGFRSFDTSLTDLMNCFSKPEERDFVSCFRTLAVILFQIFSPYWHMMVDSNREVECSCWH